MKKKKNSSVGNLVETIHILPRLFSNGPLNLSEKNYNKALRQYLVTSELKGAPNVE